MWPIWTEANAPAAKLDTPSQELMRTAEERHRVRLEVGRVVVPWVGVR